MGPDFLQCVTNGVLAYSNSSALRSFFCAIPSYSADVERTHTLTHTVRAALFFIYLCIYCLQPPCPLSPFYHGLVLVHVKVESNQVYNPNIPLHFLIWRRIKSLQRDQGKKSLLITTIFIFFISNASLCIHVSNH